MPEHARMISGDAIRRAEVLAEFSALGAGSMEYGGWSVERRTSQAQKARDRARVVSDVQVGPARRSRREGPAAPVRLLRRASPPRAVQARARSEVVLGQVLRALVRPRQG